MGRFSGVRGAARAGGGLKRILMSGLPGTPRERPQRFETRKAVVGGLALGGASLAGLGIRRIVRSGPRFAPWERPPFERFRRKVLILGGGFAGYNCAKHLCTLTWGRDDVGVMLISRDNYLTFRAMVPGIISSDVGIANIAQPLRRKLIRMGASVRRAEIETVDFERRVVIADGKEFPYDQLVLALGAEPAFFGIPGVEEHAVSMKGVVEALAIRDLVIDRFEEVTLHGGEVSESKLNFVVIGAGATGVETAAQLHVLINHVLAPEYPNIDTARSRIFLLDGRPNILPELDPGLRRVAHGQLAARKIEVMTNTLATEVGDGYVKLASGREIPSENVIWTAGARPNALVEKIGLPLVERTRGLKVDLNLRVAGFDNVWGVGDCATIPDGHGGFVPPNGQAASKEGAHVAKNVLAVIDGKEPTPFRYKSMGQLVELGSHFAVNDIFGVRFSGRLASLVWQAAHLMLLESPHGRARQAFDWLLGYFLEPSVSRIRQSQPRIPVTAQQRSGNGI